MINKNNSRYPTYRVLLIIAFLAGFVSLAYEIVATKVPYYFFNESTITTSTVISIFLFGIGLGSFIFSRVEKNLRSTQINSFGSAADRSLRRFYFHGL